ncbi:DUF5022 domain-containing protein [Fusibacter sp. 3D3]|uniref:DUF5022 domain-containing protein n=1 Tax=Fusibacter sp. 3D3 TaxID=1048380 RepID=UPI000852D029|nr:DUF5022 domain-containing protein [Fusibacter sp. 3D3]GAU80089.1 hypothetical protein F3D3_4755 [Fusibacter sp. 3D3]
MKKIISIVLIFTVICSFNVTSAVPKNNLTVNEKIFITTNNNGQTILGNKKNGTEAVLILDTGIYMGGNGNYYSLTGTEFLQQVQLLEFNLTNTSYIKYSLPRYSIPKEILSDIETASFEAIANNEIDSMMTLVIPYKPLLRGSYYQDYTYNGTPMRDYYIYGFDKDTGNKTIASGIEAKSFANAATTFAVTGLGLTTVPLSYLAGGISLILAFYDYVEDTNFSGSSQDFVQIRVIYDVSTKYTYADIGNGWQIGLVSENVYLTSIDTLQYYAGSTYNNTITKTKLINKTITSPNYFNPAPIAVNFITNPRNEELTTRFGGYTLHY